MQQDVVQRLAPPLGCLDADPQPFDHARLPNALIEGLRAQGAEHFLLFGRRLGIEALPRHMRVPWSSGVPRCSR